MNIIPSRKKVPLEPSWVRPSRRLVRVEEVTPPNSESPIVYTMSDEPEIPVPPEPTTHDILKALLAKKESLNRAINKSAPSTAPQAPPVQVFDDCDQYAEDSPDLGQPF